jgi:hypothetical protein
MKPLLDSAAGRRSSGRKCMRRKTWYSAFVLCGMSVFTLTGCPVAADFFNPSVFTGLGLDPRTITPSQGTLIVLFRNETQSPAVFRAFESSRTSNFTAQNSRNFTVGVEAGESRNEVLDCPIRLFTPGAVDAAGVRDDVAVLTGTAEAAVTVNYEGAILQVGTDYQCGDVIQVTLTEATTGGDNAETNFALIVQVIPGR